MVNNVATAVKIYTEELNTLNYIGCISDTILLIMLVCILIKHLRMHKNEYMSTVKNATTLGMFSIMSLWSVFIYVLTTIVEKKLKCICSIYACGVDATKSISDNLFIGSLIILALIIANVLCLRHKYNTNTCERCLNG